jgi:AraC-like DNA-binding protein
MFRRHSCYTIYWPESPHQGALRYNFAGVNPAGTTRVGTSCVTSVIASVSSGDFVPHIGRPGLAPPRWSFRTSDVDETRHAISTHFYPNFLQPLERSARLTTHFDIIRVGAVTLGDMRCGAEVRINFGELGAYHVDLPLAGHVLWRQGRPRPVIATTTSAAVFQPVGDLTLERWSGDGRLLVVKLDRRTLENQLEAMLGRPIRSPIRLSSSLDVSRGPGRSWAQLAATLAREFDNRDGLVYQPLVAERLSEALISGLLLAVDHPYRDLLDRTPGHCSSRAVKRAIDAMNARPEYPFTAARLAEVAAVSVRTLQEAFRHDVGVPPMTYLRQLRLARAHNDLCQADPHQQTVADVAHRWGFVHLGRFAAAYRARYGVGPSETLRGASTRLLAGS